MSDSIQKECLATSLEHSKTYSPSELCELINTRFNVPILPRTLLNYEQWGLISSPKRGGHGRGQGRWSSYEQSAAIEAYVAWLFLHGKYATPNTVQLVGDQMPPIPSQTASLLKAAFEIFEANLYQSASGENKESDSQTELWNQAFRAAEQALQSLPNATTASVFDTSKIFTRALFATPITLPILFVRASRQMALSMEMESLFPVTALIASLVIFWAQVTWGARKTLVV